MISYSEWEEVHPSIKVHYWSLMFSGAVVVVQKRYKARRIFDLFLYSASNVPKLLWTAEIERNVANVGPHKTCSLYTKCSTEAVG